MRRALLILLCFVLGEEVNENIHHCELFYVARLIFTKLQELSPSFLTNIWRIRSIFIYQSILDERSSSLYNEFIAVNKSFDIEEAHQERNIARFYTEVSHLLTYYGRVTQAAEYLNKAKECVGMDIKLIGEMGKRTKYQKDSVAQVRLTVDLGTHYDIEKEGNLPDIVKLDDDVRLESIAWDSNNEDTVPLPGLEQAVLLADVAYRQRAIPQDELSLEEIIPYVNYVLKQQCCWPARLSALYSKCKLESTHKRTIERALNQSENIINNINSSQATLLQRIQNFWAISPLPKWKLQSQLAELLLSLGLTKSALDLYLALSLWEDVILCYTILQMRHKSAEIIQQEIEKKPSVKLLCLLGDATDDVTCYEKAWNLSEQKSGRPYRHWGQYLYLKANYEECIPYFQKSLEINSLQALVWLRLGYAALTIENWELAGQAYRRYTAIEPNTFEAWNNLARVYVAQGDKNRAYKAFTEALKTNYDNWQVWDNFMVTSLDTGHFDDVIRAYHRLIDLRERHLDVEVLSILVEALSKNHIDHAGNSIMRLEQKCLELLGRVTSLYQHEYKPWELYAKLTKDNYLKVQRLQRAHRGLIQGGDWQKDPEKCGLVITNGIVLGEACIQANDDSLKSAVRLSLRAAIGAAKRMNWEQNTDILSQLETVVNQLSL